MSNNLNIEELKYLIPDYITGDINEADKLAVEDGLRQSEELRAFHAELSETFTFVSSIKQEEPAPQYWANLLPRIHERMEAEESKKFSWANISAVWKVLVPVAAIVMIALVYYLVQPSDTQITKDDKKTEQKDTNKPKQEKQDPNEQNKQQPETNEQKVIQPDENNIVKEVQPNVRERHAVNPTNDNGNNTANNENKPEEIEDIQLPQNGNGDVASVELEETSIFTSGESAGLDEELEDDLKKLDNKEMDRLLRELEGSNL